jgi:hypothetical protein
VAGSEKTKRGLAGVYIEARQAGRQASVPAEVDRGQGGVMRSDGEPQQINREGEEMQRVGGGSSRG